MEKYFTFRSTEKKDKCIISEEISNKAQGSTVPFRVCILSINMSQIKVFGGLFQLKSL